MMWKKNQKNSEDQATLDSMARCVWFLQFELENILVYNSSIFKGSERQSLVVLYKCSIVEKSYDSFETYATCLYCIFVQRKRKFNF